MSDAGRRGLGRPFWRLWAASGLSSLGDGIQAAALPLLARSLTADARVIALVTVATYLPMVLLGLPSGAVADRVDRRGLMWRIDLARGTAVLAFAALVHAGRYGMALVVALTALLSSSGIFFDNASSAFLPMLVGRAHLERANAWLMTTMTFATMAAGPVLGVALFTRAASVPFTVNGFSFFVAALLVGIGITGRFDARAPSTAEAGRSSTRHEIAEGLRWLWGSTFLRALAVLLAVINGGLAAAEAVLVVLAKDGLRIGDSGYAVLLLALAVGGLAGGAVASRVRAAAGVRGALAAGGGLIALGGLLVGVVSSAPLSTGGLALAGAGMMLWNVVAVSTRQAIVPQELLGRVTSAYRVVGFSGMPLLAWLGGVVAHAYGVRATYLASAALVGAATVATLPWLPREVLSSAGPAAPGRGP